MSNNNSPDNKLSKTLLFEGIRTSSLSVIKGRLTPLLDELGNLVDSDNSTILHVTTNSSSHEVLLHFLEEYDKKIQEHINEAVEGNAFTREKKLIWLNKKDSQGFACIHYAVFRGSYKMAFLLQEHGADIYAINKQGLTVMHIAAQGDSPILMFYYLHKGMKISAEDSKGSTALHWACYSGQENAVYALLSWGAEINKQDFTYGMTPLHLAVMSGNGRIVKKLLMKGCDRNLKNYSGRLALDIAIQSQYKNISQMIIDKQGLEQFLNIKTPFRKIDKRTLPFYFLVVLFLINYILNVSFVIFLHFPDQSSELALIYLFVGLIVMLFFVIICNKSPGKIQRKEDQSDFEMLKKNVPTKICFDCMVVKPERSRHCEICKHCICVYDHHCPWVANCIGAHNYFWFFSFLLLMWVFMTFTVVFEAINLSNVVWENPPAIEIVRIVCIFFGLVISGVFFIPLTFLILVQLKNLFNNQTTFERYGNHLKQASKAGSSSRHSENSLSSALLQKENNTHSGSMVGEQSIKSPSFIQKQSNPGKNCLDMCFRNSNIIQYQIGGIV